MDKFDSREAAMAAALGAAISDPDAMENGFAVLACRGTDHCVQVDPSPEFQMACAKCERTVVAPGGHA